MLRKELYYLASDQLKGRGAGTPELGPAAEYIAKRFLIIGLKPLSTTGYLQTVPLKTPGVAVIDLTLTIGSQQFSLSRRNASATAHADLTFTSTPVIKLDAAHAQTFTPSDLRGKLVVAASPLPANAREAAALLVPFGVRTQSRRVTVRTDEPPPAFASIITSDEAVTRWIESLPVGNVEGASTSGRAAVGHRPVEVHKVMAILPGSDPALRDTYVFVTAHYDHLGETESGQHESGTAPTITPAARLQCWPLPSRSAR